MKKESYDTVSEAILELKKLGYTLDFSQLNNSLRMVTQLATIVLTPDDYKIDQFYRFEGNTDPADAMILYAISSRKSPLKGLVVNGYGMYEDKITSDIVNQLNAHPRP
ncbi:phosphoribosylpyrophosphate synthetase [Paucihalobacter sp.]|uniref:phosphoribosylpyrophosphate synthetase n=1 Tax=Paucihalobacter sp. TaxID=2850405 RepID=UPI002FDFBBA4